MTSKCEDTHYKADSNLRRFGNFIGEVDESEEAESVHETTAADAYLDDDDEEAEIDNQQLMGLDGINSSIRKHDHRLTTSR